MFLLKTGHPAVATAVAAVAAMLLLGCSPSARTPATVVKPHPTVFRLPPGALGSAAGEAAGRAVLLKVAGAAARASAPAAAGRYWVTPGLAGNFVEVGSPALHYLVLEKVATQNWAAGPAAGAARRWRSR